MPPTASGTPTNNIMIPSGGVGSHIDLPSPSQQQTNAARAGTSGYDVFGNPVANMPPIPASITTANSSSNPPVVPPPQPVDTTNYKAITAGAIANNNNQASAGTSTADPTQDPLYQLLKQNIDAQKPTPDTSIQDIYGETPSQIAQNQQAAQAASIAAKNAVTQAESNANSLKAQIQAITDSGEAQKIQLEQTINQGSSGVGGAGSMANLSFLNVRKTEIDKNTAIAVLPLQSQVLAAQAAVASANGDYQAARDTLASANDMLSKVFEIHKADVAAQNQWQKDSLDKLSAFFTEEQRTQAQAAKDQSDKNAAQITDALRNAQTIAHDLNSYDPQTAAKITALIPPQTASDIPAYNAQVAALQTEAKNKNQMVSSGSALNLSPDTMAFYSDVALSGVSINNLIPSFGFGNKSVSARSAFLESLAQKAKILGISGADFAAIVTDSRAKQQAYSQIQKQGTIMTANEQKTISDFELLKQAGVKMNNASWQVAIPAINAWLRTGQIALTGNSAVNNYIGLLTTTLTNYAKVVSGQSTMAGVTQFANQEIQGLISKGLSTQTVNDYIENVAKPEMKNTIDGYNGAAKNLFGSLQNAGSAGNQGGVLNTTESQSNAKGSQNDSQFVESSLNALGLKYNDVLNQIPSGQKGVIINATGQIGYIPPNEYDPSIYTSLK